MSPFRDIFARYRRSEQTLVPALMEIYVNGVSTRRVRQITEELCGCDFSRFTVSDPCRKPDAGRDVFFRTVPLSAPGSTPGTGRSWGS